MKRYHDFSGVVTFFHLLSRPKRSYYYTPSWIQIVLYADGIPLVHHTSYHIYLRGLRQSLESSGRFSIICCRCGYAYCDAEGELWVHINHHGDVVEWRNGENLPEGHYFFRKEQYQAVVQELTNEVHRFFSEHSEQMWQRVSADSMGGTIEAFPNELWDDWQKEQI